MGVKIAEDQGVSSVEGVDDGIDVEGVARRAGRNWRDVSVDDVDRRTADVSVDGDDFDGGVRLGDGESVDESKGDGVVDECDEAAATAAWTIHTDGVIVSEVRRASRLREFCFLKASDDDVSVFEELTKFGER